MRLRFSALIAALFASALADVLITSPAAGAQVPAGPITVTWKDSGTGPSLSQLKSYTLTLVVGGNDQASQTPLTTLTSTGEFGAGNTLTGTVPPGLAGNTVNGFFLQMTSVATEGGTIINYSSRFTMTGMTGITPQAAQQAVQELGGSTAGPPTQNNLNNAPAAGGGGAGAGLPYNSQTGLTKYAPMQPVPPTKITAGSPTPLYPTSAFTIATTWLPHPSIVTTVTTPQTFSVQSMENTAAPQSQPSGNMAKFLARWKD